MQSNLRIPPSIFAAVVGMAWASPAGASPCGHAPPSASCYTLVYVDDTLANLLAFDPVSGESCEVLTDLPLAVSDLTGLARVGDTVSGCAGGVLTRVDISTGGITATDLECASAGSVGEELLLLPNENGASAGWYADATRAEEGRPDLEIQAAGLALGTINSDSALIGPRTGGNLRVIDIGSGQPQAGVTLEGFTGWAWGMTVRGSELLLVDDGRQTAEGARATPAVRRFDVSTGAALGSAPLALAGGSAPHGLVCGGP